MITTLKASKKFPLVKAVEIVHFPGSHHIARRNLKSGFFMRMALRAFRAQGLEHDRKTRRVGWQYTALTTHDYWTLPKSKLNITLFLVARCRKLR